MVHKSVPIQNLGNPETKFFLFHARTSIFLVVPWTGSWLPSRKSLALKGYEIQNTSRWVNTSFSLSTLLYIDTRPFPFPTGFPCVSARLCDCSDSHGKKKNKLATKFNVKLVIKFYTFTLLFPARFYFHLMSPLVNASPERWDVRGWRIYRVKHKLAQSPVGWL